MTDTRFSHPTYTIRKKFWRILGGAFHVYGSDDQLVGYANQRFKLREDIRLYTDESMTTELLTILARKVIDFSPTFDVLDATTGTKVGVLQRKGLKSMVMDEWIVMDPDERPIGSIREESAFLAILRRFVVGSLLPQEFLVEIGGRDVAIFRQRFNPFVQRIVLDFSADTAGALDRRLGLAAGVLLSAIEGRQANG
jgi:hypothetical protein